MEKSGLPEKVRVFFASMSADEKKEFMKYMNLYLTPGDVVEDIVGAMNKTAEEFDAGHRV